MKNPAFRPQRLNYVASVNAARKTAGATCPHCGEGGIEQAASRCPGCNYQLQWEINFGGGDWPLVDAYDDGHVGSRKRASVCSTCEGTGETEAGRTCPTCMGGKYVSDLNLAQTARRRAARKTALD